jgi:hypothetical protein
MSLRRREFRQVLGAPTQFEKANVVAKLKAARDRKREATGRCEGNKPLSETRPEVSFLESTPQAYGLQVSNAAPPFSTAAGTSPIRMERLENYILRNYRQND